jgi:hypothetical protein
MFSKTIFYVFPKPKLIKFYTIKLLHLKPAFLKEQLIITSQSFNAQENGRGFMIVLL